MNAELVDALNQWRAELERNLRMEYSWLSLAGLFWLQEGENSFGSVADNSIQLPHGPAHAGSFHLQDGDVTISLFDTVDAASNNGSPVPIDRPLKADITGEPDYVLFEGMRMVLIERNGEQAIRAWDSQHPNRLNFRGRQWYPPEEKYRLTAQINPYDLPKAVMVPNVLGYDTPSQMDVQLHMELDGRPFTLDAERLDNGAYYLIFKDGSAGQGTYPSGRFLVSEQPEGDSVVVDFNRAYNPPCAFTQHATCPLPTKENSLSFAILAGEKYTPIK